MKIFQLLTGLWVVFLCFAQPAQAASKLCKDHVLALKLTAEESLMYFDFIKMLEQADEIVAVVEALEEGK